MTGIVIGASYSIYAHNVGQAQTSKFFHPDTVQMLVDRADGVIPGGPGLRNGDILTYVIESVPAPNGASLGSAGYITDYIPPGLSVVGAGIANRVANPDKIGGYDYVYESAPLPGQMEDGFGIRGSNYAAAAPPPAGTLSDGVIAHVTQDTGIFYSTDSRTQRIATPYDVTGDTASRLAPGQAAFLIYNDWDYDQFDGLVLNGNGLINGASSNGNTPVFIDSSSGALTGIGSAVAGPDSCYINDINPNLGAGFAALQNPGPWQRISYPGSMVGCSAPYVATVQGVNTITGVTTLSGYSLSISNPLPANTNTVRWAIGERAVGSLEHVILKVRITDLAAFSAGNAVTPAYTNQSSVFGGDASGSQDGKDNVYRYIGPSHANNNAQLYVLKQAVAVSNSATGPWAEFDGIFVRQGDFVKYRLTYLNGASSELSNVIISDATDANSVTYISSTTGAPYVGSASYAAPTLTWPTITSLAPGDGGTFEVVVEITGSPNPPITTNTVNASANAGQIEATAATVSNITTTGAPAALALNKTVTPSAVSGIGDVVTYTMIIDNVGGALNNEVKQVDKTVPTNPAAASIGMVIGDRLPKTGGVNDISYQATSRVELTDLDTGFVYNITAALGSTITIDTTNSTGDVFWVFENVLFPAGHPRAGQVFDFVDSRITIVFTATANTAVGGVYYNDIEGHVGQDVDGKVRNIKFTEYDLAPVSIASPNFIGSTKTANDLNAGDVTPGDIIRYDFDLGNSGAGPTTSVVMSDVLPTSSAFVVGSVVASGASVVYRDVAAAVIATPVADGDGVDTSVASIEFSWGAIAVSANVTPSFEVRVNTPSNDGEQLVNQGSILVDGNITYLTDDPTVPGDTDETIVTVVANPDFSASTKMVLVNGAVATTADYGDTVEYTITLNDTGYAAGGAYNISVTDAVDLNVYENIVLGANPAGWVSSGPDAGGLITWYAVNFDYNDSVVFSFTATVKNGLSNGTTLDNAVLITSDETPDVTVHAPTLIVPIITVSGTVFDDENDDNVQNGAEGGLSGVTVAIRVAGFVSDVIVATTDANGAFSITVPVQSDWLIVVTDINGVLAGRTLSNGGIHPIALTLVDGDVVTNNDFGYHLDTLPATIDGNIFNDLNGNSVDDGAGEAGYAGVTLDVKNAAGNTVTSAITDVNGDYSFTNLAPDTYTVEITDGSNILTGLFGTGPSSSPATVLNLLENSTQTVKFGYQAGNQIAGLIFSDDNNDAIYDVGESGIANVTIELRPNGGGAGSALQTVITDISGNYVFTAVADASYDVVITDANTVLGALAATGPFTTPKNVVMASADQSAIDFGYYANPSLTVDKTVNVGVAGFNEAVIYTMVITNSGGALANAVIRDVLPSTIASAPYTTSANTFQYLSTDNVTLNGAAFTIPNLPTVFDNTPEWSGFDLPAASTLEITFTAFTGLNEGVNYNGIKITGGSPVTSTDYPDLVIVTLSDSGEVNKTVSKINGVTYAGVGTPTVTAGDTVTYRATLSNTGAAIAQEISQIVDVLPAGFIYVPNSSALTATLNAPGNPLADPVIVGQTLTWSFAAPRPGTSAIASETLYLEFDVTVPSGVSGTFTNNVTMTVSNNAGLTFQDLSSGDVAELVVTQFSLGDLVFSDINGNGIYEPGGGDTGVVNVSVELRASGSSVAIQTTTTDINGNYLFATEIAGDYDVVVTDSGAVMLGYAAPVGGNTQSVTVNGIAPSVQTLDFGYQPPAGASDMQGTVFLDENANGVQDAAEVTGYPGLTVNLYNVLGTLVGVTTTDANGDYSFINRAGGLYTVSVATPPVNVEQTTAQPLNIILPDASTSVDNDMGYQPAAVITGLMFADINNNAVYDAGTDALLAGATVNLKLATVIQATTTTNASGVYTFSDVSLNGKASETYDVDVDQAVAPISGATLTTANEPQSVIVSSGNTTSATDIGYFIQGSISGTVYEDLDVDNAYILGNDAELQSVTVELYDAAGVTLLQTTSSAADGSYTLAGLVDASYTVKVIAPAGYAASAPVSGEQVVVVAASANVTAIDFGHISLGSISGTAYEDLDADGAYILGNDTELQSVTVELYDATGVTLLQTTSSAADGSYTFINLVDASYTVKVAAPAGYSASAPVSGERVVVVAGGVDVTGEDFGFVLPPDLVVTKTHSPLGLAGKDDVITYTITITNNGATATGVTVTDYLPSNAPADGGNTPAPTASPEDIRFDATTSVEIDAAGVAYTEANPNNEEVSWASNPAGGFTLANGQVLEVVFTAIVRKDKEGLRYNSVAINHDGGTDWNPDIDSILVVKDWGAVKTVTAINSVSCVPCGLQDINIGDTVTYQIAVENKKGGGKVGKNSIETATIVDTLPLGFKYVTNTTVAVSPGNATAADMTGGVYEPTVSPAAGAATNEVLTWSFTDVPDLGDNVNPDVVDPHLITGPNVGDTATLTFDVVAVDSVTPNNPTPGLNYNNVDVSAKIVDKDANAPLNLTLEPVAVNVLAPPPSFMLLKSVVVTNDPVFAATGGAPHAIPGAEVLYTIRVINSGAGSADAETIVINDPIPAGTELFVGDLSAGKPYVFVNGAGIQSSTLSCPFVSLATTGVGDCVEFYDASNVSFAPTADYDNTVSVIEINPGGTFAGAAGGSNTYFEFKFRVRIK